MKRKLNTERLLAHAATARHGRRGSLRPLTQSPLQPGGQQAKKPNIVMLMTDDVGWADFGYISGGGATLGHPTPNIDRIAKEGTSTSPVGMGRRVAPRAAARS